MVNSIGYRIKTRREELDLSQDELARRLGYKSRSSITKIEKDGRELPQKKIADIARVLQTTPAYIMGWEEEQKKNDVQTNIVVRIRYDADFAEAVHNLYLLDSEKFASIKQLLKTLV